MFISAIVWPLTPVIFLPPALLCAVTVGNRGTV